MKLYTKITSERGKEVGKGGNKYLGIDIFVGDAKNPTRLCALTVRRDDDPDYTNESVYAVYDENNEVLAWIPLSEVGGERPLSDSKIQKCAKCGSRVHTNLDNWDCANCGHYNRFRKCAQYGCGRAAEPGGEYCLAH